MQWWIYLAKTFECIDRFIKPRSVNTLVNLSSQDLPMQWQFCLVNICKCNDRFVYSTSVNTKTGLSRQIPVNAIIVLSSKI